MVNKYLLEKLSGVKLQSLSPMKWAAVEISAQLSKRLAPFRMYPLNFQPPENPEFCPLTPQAIRL